MAKGSGFNGSNQCMKMAAFVSSVISISIGGAALVVGIWLTADRLFMTYFLPSTVPEASVYIFLSAGALNFVGGFAGFLGTFRKSRNLMMLGSCLLMSGFAVALAATVMGFLYSQEERSSKDLGLSMYNSMSLYDISSPAARAWDETQYELSCCGTFSETDWIVRGISKPYSCPTSSSSIFKNLNPSSKKFDPSSTNFDPSSMNFDPSSTNFDPSSFDPSSFDPSSFDPSSFDPSSFDPSSFDPSSFDPSSFDPSSFDPSSFDMNDFEEIMSYAGGCYLGVKNTVEQNGIIIGAIGVTQSVLVLPAVILLIIVGRKVQAL